LTSFSTSLSLRLFLLLPLLLFFLSQVNSSLTFMNGDESKPVLEDFIGRLLF
jgi:hypothetical protein